MQPVSATVATVVSDDVAAFAVVVGLGLRRLFGGSDLLGLSLLGLRNLGSRSLGSRSPLRGNRLAALSGGDRLLAGDQALADARAAVVAAATAAAAGLSSRGEGERAGDQRSGERGDEFRGHGSLRLFLFRRSSGLAAVVQVMQPSHLEFAAAVPPGTGNKFSPAPHRDCFLM